MVDELSKYEFDFILREVLNKSYSDYLIYGLDKIEEEKIKPYLELAKIKPVEYIFNKAYFRDIVLYVDERVLIPRNETEQLVDIAIEIIKKKNYKNILEIGIGSGAISISLALEINNIKIFANDISFKALEVAKINIKNYKLDNRIFLFCSDTLKAIKSKFDMIIWNIPYVFKEEYEYLSEKVKCEPAIALLYNDELFENFLKNFKFFLSKDGCCLLEISPKLSNKLKKFNFEIIKDIYDVERFSLFFNS
ncbi:MAG: HemK/PrmC family methyltransferase [candidate division WOR-3 bacterium]